VRDVIGAEDEDEEGEDLFGPGIDEYGGFFLFTFGRRVCSRSIITVTMGKMSCLTRTQMPA